MLRIHCWLIMHCASRQEPSRMRRGLKNLHLYRFVVSCIHEPLLLVVQILVESKVFQEAHGSSFGRRVIAFPEGRGP